jgi:hypothetical protein
LRRVVYEKIDAASKDIINLTGYLTLDDFRKIMSAFRDYMQKHNFFFQDLFFILQHYPEVGKLYEATNLLRLKQGRSLYNS